MTIPGSKKALFYDAILKFSVYSMIGIGIITSGLIVYNCYLFKRGTCKFRKKVDLIINIKYTNFFRSTILYLYIILKNNLKFVL